MSENDNDDTARAAQDPRRSSLQVENAIERQMLLSPRIVSSPVPSELDTCSGRSGSRTGSLLANDDLDDEECDLSDDEDAIARQTPANTTTEEVDVEAVDEKARRDSAFKDIEKYRTLGTKGLKLILTGGLEEAKELFKNNESAHPLMANGAAFVVFFASVVAFDEAMFPIAKHKVSRCQKICKTLMQAARKKLKHEKGVDRGSLPEIKLNAIVMYYEARLSIADCWCYTGLLTACKMDLTSYIKAGWQLRRAFKIYVKVYRELNTPKISQLRFPGYSGAREKERLLTSASFGYGIFHLALSLVPPAHLALMKIFGMCGDRRTGLLALRYCVEKGWGPGLEPRAPFALLSILWYYVYLRPLMTVSKLERQRSMVYAKHLMRQYKMIGEAVEDIKSITTADLGDLGDSACFILMRARILRNSLRLDEAFATCNVALESQGVDSWMKELNQLLKYEASWSQMSQLKFSEAGPKLMAIHETTRWSKVNYLYPATLCRANYISGKSSDEEIKEVMALFSQIKAAKIKSGNQVEVFVQSRANLVLELMQQQEKPKTKDQSFPDKKEFLRILCETLTYECMYHWGVLPRCVTIDLMDGKIFTCLKRVEGNKDLDALSKFLQGVILKQKNDFDEAKNALIAAKNTKLNHKRLRLVQPFACLEIAGLVVQKAEKQDLDANKNNGVINSKEVAHYLHEAKKAKSGYDFEHRIQFYLHNLSKRGDELWLPSTVGLQSTKNASTGAAAKSSSLAATAAATAAANKGRK